MSLLKSFFNKILTCIKPYHILVVIYIIQRQDLEINNKLMVKRLLTFVLLLTGSISMLAQNRTITGSLYDGELKEKVPLLLFSC